ncbi:MAG TPA: hypothetical protein DCZ92_05040 [Elusimicrobia bacterium]|nr:MAG: hypothetical protein A2016_12740 [Elusimicrobia bacterium GWF2_62_30]HBA60172.1 hypothetical protein [Elusimicrobiota bacterium]
MKIFLTLLLLLPALAGARDNAGGPYRSLVTELLRNCDGKDKKLAVANFSYPDERASGDGNIISGRITTELVRLKKFKVTERKEIEKVFEELKLQGSGAIDADSVKDIGKMLGADWLILGTLAELEDKQIEVNARLVGVESGEIINAFNVKVRKDWRDKLKNQPPEEHELKDSDKLKSYDKAILKYIDEKTGKKTPAERSIP